MGARRTLHAILAHAALCAGGREGLEVALRFRSDAILRDLREQELLAHRYWLYICRYRDFTEMYKDDELDPQPFYVLFSPADLERFPLLIGDSLG